MRITTTTNSIMREADAELMARIQRRCDVSDRDTKDRVIFLRVPASLHARIAAAARDSRRSINDWATLALAESAPQAAADPPERRARVVWSVERDRVVGGGLFSVRDSFGELVASEMSLGLAEQTALIRARQRGLYVTFDESQIVDGR